MPLAAMSVWQGIAMDSLEIIVRAHHAQPFYALWAGNVRLFQEWPACRMSSKEGREEGRKEGRKEGWKDTHAHVSNFQVLVFEYLRNDLVYGEKYSYDHDSIRGGPPTGRTRVGHGRPG
jgi:hypothetical protein